MSDLLLSIYNFFRTRKVLFIFIVLLVTAGAILAGLQLKMKENISDLMPNDPKVRKINQIFQNSRFTDKMVINVYLKDSVANDAEKLVAFSDSLAGSIRANVPAELISELRVKVSDEIIGDVFNSVYDNLPVYLTEKDYSRIDSLITPARIDSQLGRNYRTLVSPASLVLKKFVVKDPLGIGGTVLKKLQKLQYDENYELYDGHIVTKNHKNLLFFISPANPPNETGKNLPLIEGLDKAFEKTTAQFDNKVNAEYFGAVAMSVGNAERIKSDISITVSLAMALLVIFMTLFFRKVYVILIIFLPVAIGGIISIGALYFLRGEISAIALGMGSVLLGITVDYSLHIFTHHRTTGSVKAVYKDLTLPLLLSCLITASSFLCLLFVKSDALKDLGLFAAISVVNALVAAMVILPHFLSSKKSGNGNESTSGMAFLERIISYRFDKSKVLITVILVITVVSFFTSGNVQFETDMMKLNYVSHKLYKAENNLYKISNQALKSIYIVASGDNMEEALKANEIIESRVSGLKSKGTVKAFSGVGDFILSEALQKQRIAVWNKFWTPAKKAQLKEYLLQEGQKYKFKENAFAPFFTLLDKEFTVVGKAENETLRTLLFNDFISEKPGFSTVVTLLKVDDNRKDEVYAAFPDHENITVVDRKQITSKFVELMRDDFNTLEVLSLGLVFFVLILCYGRIELGLIAFIPMILSWLWTIGIMGLLGIKFNILNIIISTFILGLGIDYSIFIMSGLIEEYKNGVTHLASFKTSIFLSAFTSISGIGALIFADHPALKSIAVLSIIGMCSVITISYTLQPLLFRKLITDRTSKGLYPFTAKSLFLTLFAYTYFLAGCFILTTHAIGILPILPFVKKKTKKKYFHKILQLFCKSMIYIMGNVKKRIINTTGEDFSKPAIVIANHQSFLDILLTVMLSPKIILVTNDWVWNSPFFGRVVKYADFFPASMGMEDGLEGLEERVKNGYSIVIFPEGTRSTDGSIGRFHKGAFFLAEKLNIDILPVLLHGTGDTITKGDLLLKDGELTVKYLPRIKPGDAKFGETYQERTKLISKFFKKEYEKLQKEIETPAYYRDNLIKNYIYKGPVLEWYMRIKTRLENNYKFFHEILPLKGKIVDIGCGYGFLPYMLQFLSKEREITGLDYDEEKIQVASKCFSKTDTLNFISCDVTNYELPEADAFIIADVLHYFPTELQDKLIFQCMEKLSENGILVIRDGNSDIADRHKGTKLTEFFSIKLFKFNKSEHKVSYISGRHLKDVCLSRNLDVEIFDNAKLTSNTFYLIRKNKTAVPVA